MNDFTQNEQENKKRRINGYCPTCDCVRELKTYEQVFDAKYNLPTKTYADCIHCKNTFRYPVAKES